MSVTAIADALGLTHPAVNQIATQMARRGLLTSRKDKDDERRRLLSLTPKGRQTVKKLQPLWSVVDECTRQLIKVTGHDLLADIAAVEKALDSRDMYDRTMRSLRKQQSLEIPPGRERASRRRRKSTAAAMNSTTKRKPRIKE
jgi:DNA-binding MarR family transcriptional regulator